MDSMKGRFKKAVSIFLAITMVFSLFQGVSIMANASTPKVYERLDASAPNWTSISGFTNAVTVAGGAQLTGTASYGNGVVFNQKVDTSEEIDFDLSFTNQTIATTGWFCLTLGNPDYSLDPENTTGKGISFLMYKKADAAIQSARDTVDRWLDFPFEQKNSFQIKKGTTDWELYLKNSIITSYALIGKIPFEKVDENVFSGNLAKLGIYVCNISGHEQDPIAFQVTNLIHKTEQAKKQAIVLTGENANFEPTQTGDFTVTPVDWGVKASGTAAFGTGVSSKLPLNVSNEVSFQLNFSKTIPAGGFFAVALAGNGYTFDPDNAGGKGITYLIYQKAEQAIQSARDVSNRWLDFPAGEDNILTIRKGTDAWELYLQNRIISDHMELIGKIPFTTAPADMFANNQAKLMLYTYNGDPATTSFQITHLTNTVTTSDEPESQLEEVQLNAGASQWTPSGDYTVSDIAGGAKMHGTAGFKYGVTYKEKLDVSVRSEFDLKFSEQALTTGSSFIGITFGKDADSFNDAGKGATFLLYKTASAAIQSDKDTVSRWLDFPFDGVNSFKFGKGTDGWELYLKNSIITNYTLIGKIPYTTLAEDAFADDKATLGVYVYDGAASTQPIQFEVTNMKHMTTKGSDVFKPILDKYDLATDMVPFWQGNTVYNESLMFVANADGSVPSAPLLYVPTEIVSVRSSDLKTEYAQGSDWVLENGRLKIPQGSKIPVVSNSQYYPASSSANAFDTVDGKYIYFSEGAYFHTKQIAVTYKHNTAWTGIIPQYKGTSLPKTIAKLKGKQALKIVYYGDSITTGANSSSIINAAPFAASWPQMVTESLKKAYDYDAITTDNTAVGGKSSAWGADNAKERVADHTPDLVIIGFGMNDGNGSAVLPSTFKNNIQSIMDTVKLTNPNAEFLLVSTTLPNPEVKMTQGNQSEYEQELNDLACTGVAVAPMTSIHEYLLQLKRFYDMTGNNVNHPNDFLARVYAQVINAALVNSSKTQSVLYPDKTFLLPTNETYWNCANESSVNGCTVSINASGVATYTGSKLENRLAQFNFSADVTGDNWVGLMARQSNPGSAPWDQSQVYWVIIKKNGTVELLKKKGGSVSTIATSSIGSSIDADGHIALTTVRFGTIDEKDGVRIVLDMGKDNILNFVDTTNTIDDPGLFGIVTLNTATAKIFTGLNGTDSDSEINYGGYGKGKGYLGGAINPEYLVNWAELSNYEYKGSVLENTVDPQEIQTGLDESDIVSQIKEPGSKPIVIALDKGYILTKAIFEELKGTDKTLVIKIVDKNGKVLYSWTFVGTDITGDLQDVNLTLDFGGADTVKIAKLTKQTDFLPIILAHHGQLPGKANLHIYAGAKYKNGDSLRLYYYNSADESIKLVSKDILVDANGYVDLSITHASTYFLTKDSLNDVSNSPDTGDRSNTTAVLFFIFSFLCGSTLLLLNKKSRKRRG